MTKINYMKIVYTDVVSIVKTNFLLIEHNFRSIFLFFVDKN